ncbi:MAG TPA: helix-turn-helix transcriptional regulator [Methylomirabilota bacterium]|jgi:transcriptional regulator with XRE-family HTH domain|nr:helix-turn-helix transcriptional regulator [Methylomirabilota bacterium]
MTNYPFTTWFRRELRRYLREHGIRSRNDLAKKVGTSGASLHRYDRGLSFPDVRMQARLAEVFGVSEEDVARLVRESEKRRQQEAEGLDEPPSSSAMTAGRRGSRQVQDSWLGKFASSGRIIGDIVSPAVDEREWEVLRPRRR